MTQPLRLHRTESAGKGESLEMTTGGISGTGSYLPDRRVPNSELEQILDTSDEWIVQRVGIQSRHIAGPDEGTLDLATQASLNALESAQLEPSELGLIIVATATPDQNLPSVAAMLQKRLGAVGSMAFDLSAACSGFLFGLASADGLLHSCGIQNALIVGAETLSRITDWNDRNTCVLFGDGAGAVVLQTKQDEPSPILASVLRTDGENCNFIRRTGTPFPPITAPGIQSEAPQQQPHSDYIKMEGREVFKLGVQCMAQTALEVMQKANVSVSDIDLFIPHQSNARMLESVCKQVGPELQDVLFDNIAQVGNTSAASIPIALDEANRAGRIKPGDLILLSAVGAGMTYGSLLLRW